MSKLTEDIRNQRNQRKDSKWTVCHSLLVLESWNPTNLIDEWDNHEIQQITEKHLYKLYVVDTNFVIVLRMFCLQVIWDQIFLHTQLFLVNALLTWIRWDWRLMRIFLEFHDWYFWLCRLVFWLLVYVPFCSIVNMRFWFLMTWFQDVVGCMLNILHWFLN